MLFHRVTPFLETAVRSILGQTWDDFEFIIVDNGTGTGLSALGEARHDPRLRLLSFATNRGVPAAVNAACAEAAGEFVALMDSDDVALPERFARQLAVLRAEPDLALLATHALVVDAAGAVLRPQFTLAAGDQQRTYTRYSLPITNPSVMGRRAIFRAFPWREEFMVGSDYDFFARVIERHPCRALPEVLLHYRRHAGQITVSRFNEMVLGATLVRMVTARRRAGRPERLAELVRDLPGWSAQSAPAASVTYAYFAGQALAEGFPLLAVFLGRRHFSKCRTPAGLARATAVLGRALAQAPGEAAMLVRMFLTGPLRAHDLRPL